jgi:hypothetical protein
MRWEALPPYRGLEPAAPYSLLKSSSARSAWRRCRDGGARLGHRDGQHMALGSRSARRLPGS